MLLFLPLHEFFPEKCRVYLKKLANMSVFCLCKSIQQFTLLLTRESINQRGMYMSKSWYTKILEQQNTGKKEHRKKGTPEHWNTPEYRNTRTPKHAGIPEYPATPKLSETLQNIKKKMTIMKKIVERILKNLLGILNEDKRTKIIRANCHIEVSP